MADRALRRLTRRELLQMLLVQCEETERLQQEAEEQKEKMETVMESYERLKKKLDVKDERLNQKDEKIAQLLEEIEELKALMSAAPEGSLAKAAYHINEIFEEAQQEAGQYLISLRKNRIRPLVSGDSYG